MINKVLSFRATEFECCCSFVKEYDIEVESTIRAILYSSRPIRFQIFCMLEMMELNCLPNKYASRRNFKVQPALSCKAGAFPSIRQNRVGNIY